MVIKNKNKKRFKTVS